ncbi:LysR family transcriptional regulator [Klebsiella aerogenes]|uniref:LysR family transcriptional regulator n=1 Tax=Klebsiella aerogenes TaxID=548 RepID=A0AAP9U7U0_KLEAE|nr:LysR family transcriptional regulator [Klebsiella aerogenes]QMR42838.1 LysR family transcriptional regulator [Klebsiella aerogenes]
MINDLDLKVLKAIHILCQSGSVSKTAEILEVTPGAVSYLINKARKATGTSLFFRSRHGMEPDALAKELSERYVSISEGFSLTHDESAINSRAMIISAYSLAELLLSLAVIEDENNYPELIFHRQKYDDTERLIKLRNREVDLDIGTRLPVDNSIVQISFFAGNAGVLARKNHPTVKDKVTLQDWQNNQHAIWLRGMHFINDDFDKTQKFYELSSQRNISLTASSSLNLINLCSLSDTLILVPALVGRKLSEIMPVNWFYPPAEIDMRYESFIHYHRSMAGNQSIKNLVKLFFKAFDV